MTSERVPDSISAEELMARLAKAPSDTENNETPPLGTAVPVLPLSEDDAGVLDLCIAVEQIITASGGAPLIQVLQCLLYLAVGATDRLNESIDELRQIPDPHAAEAADEMRQATLALARASTMISSVVGPVTAGAVLVRCREENIPLMGSGQVPRRIFVSDALLQALGVEPAAFTAYLRRRAHVSGWR